MNTENRRIKRHIKSKQAEKSALVVLPKTTMVPLKVRIKNIFSIVQSHFNVNKDHIGFHELAKDKEEKLATFLPVLHLSNQEKVHLHQPIHFDEIYIRNEIHPKEKQELETTLGLLTEDEEKIVEELAAGEKALELEEGERAVHIGDNAIKVGVIN